jgi:hypothetical protein
LKINAGYRGKAVEGCVCFGKRENNLIDKEKMARPVGLAIEIVRFS